mmetsp:Transcript_16952/g.49641  ORF Transcript_16952/g.49641 Transcript_16952/m.49641 type:complete len:222 (+) Transcript_16952:1246-1911(+)
MGAHQGADLYDIGEQEPGTVCFYGINVLGCYASIPNGIGDNLLLGQAVRGTQGGALAVCVDVAARNHPNKRLVRVLLHHLAVNLANHRLHCHCSHALASHIAGRADIEGEAAALGREPAHGAVLGPPDGRQHELRPDAHPEVGGERAAFLLDGLGSHVDGRETGRGVRVNGHAGALDAKDEREPVRCYTPSCPRWPTTSHVHGLVHEAPVAEGMTHVHAAS